MNKLKCCLRTVLLIAIGLFWNPVVWADLNDGLVAYYPFNGNANDYKPLSQPMSLTYYVNSKIM